MSAAASGDIPAFMAAVYARWWSLDTKYLRCGSSAASFSSRLSAAQPSISNLPHAAACGKFDIEGWAADNLDENEAAEEPQRRYFVSRLHHRAYTAAIKAGMSPEAAADMRSEITAKAGAFYDRVHKRG